MKKFTMRLVVLSSIFLSVGAAQAQKEWEAVTVYSFEQAGKVFNLV